jgi:methionyl-tRNA formyltransferase
MYPWPGCHARLVEEGGQVVQHLTLARARACPAVGESRVGHVAWNGAITTGDGALELVEVQPANGRVMSFDAYRNGHPWKPGMRVEPE